MFSKMRIALMAAAVTLTAGAVGLTTVGPSYAGAMSIAPAPNSGIQSSDLLTFAAQRKKYSKKKYSQKKYGKRWSYNRHRHGQRFRHQRDGYAYYNNGYYYPRPFWRSDPGFIIRLDL